MVIELLSLLLKELIKIFNVKIIKECKNVMDHTISCISVKKYIFLKFFNNILRILFDISHHDINNRQER